MTSSVSYEVMGFKDGRWVILFITGDREEAISEAKNAEAGKHLQAVKVIQESTDGGNGEERSKTIYSGGLQDGAAGSHGAHKAHKHIVDESGSKGKGGQGEGLQKLHPELVTDLIDRIRSFVIVIGSIILVLVIMAFAYLSNPDTVSEFLNGFLH